MATANLTLNEPLFPTYHNMATTLGCATTSTIPSQLHGILSGIICADPNHSLITSMDLLTALIQQSSNKLTQPAQTALHSLYTISVQQLNSTHCDFCLLLPDDNEKLCFRVQALGTWCTSFIEGFNIAKQRIPNPHSPNSMSSLPQEVLHDFSEIGKIDSRPIAGNETDEKAYMEISEYVRMAALMMHSEFVEPSSFSQNTAMEETLH